MPGGYTNTANVAAILGPQNYDGTTDLQQYIDTADSLVVNIVPFALAKGLPTISVAGLEIVERWLAAHFYCIMNKPIQTLAAGGMSITRQGQSTMKLSSTSWGQQAIMLDFSGYLNMIDNSGRVYANWLGTTESSGQGITG